MSTETSGKPDAWKLARPVWGWGRGETPRPTPPAKVLSEDIQEWHSHRPLGISCAATLRTDDDQPRLWHGGDRLSRDEATALVRYLEEQTSQGHTLLTWNGLGFDLDVLAKESGMLVNCRTLAQNHVDMMFHVLCRLGYGVSLDAAARTVAASERFAGWMG